MTTPGSRALSRAALALAFAACSRSMEVRSTPVATVRHTGTVVVSGADGMGLTSLSVNGRAITLTGDLVPELQTLAGARVRVDGVAATGGAVEVRSYDVLEINGETPWVGTLVSLPDGFVLESTGRIVVRLDAVPTALGRETGARVWVTGTSSDGRVRVQSWGVIRSR